MKTGLIGMYLIMHSVALAQIPNNGFENWTNAGTCLVPDGWACINDWMGNTQNCYSISRSTDHYPAGIGNYSIRIENRLAVLPDAGAFGLVWTGDSSGFGTNEPVFAVSGHPTSLCGYYKFIPENGDTMDLHYTLYKNGVSVTSGKMLLTAAALNWTPFTIPVSNPGYTSADSGRIMLSSFFSDNPIIHGNSILYVDNLSFDNLISTSVHALQAERSVMIYPNPAAETCQIQLPSSCDGGVLDMFDMVGHKILSKKLIDTGNTYLRLSSIFPGIYLVKYTAPDHITCTARLVIANH